MLKEKYNNMVRLIMNYYNGEKYLTEAIDSVYKNTYKNWEIVFWDNASKDLSAEIAKSYDSKLKYFYGEKTIPLGRARNKALEKCSGEFIAFLDCDDIWMPEKLQIQVDFMIKTDFVLSYSDGFKMLNNRKTNTSFSLQGKNYSGDVFNKLILNNFINLQTVIINKSKVRGNLYFLENLNIAEEYELFLRLSLLGKFGFLNNPLVYYRYHNHNTSNDTDGMLSESIFILKKFENSINENQINVNKI